jgi:hypothetical protein
VDDRVVLRGREEGRERGAVAEVALDKGEVRCARARELADAVDRELEAVVQVVEDRDLVALLEERERRVAADEACGRGGAGRAGERRRRRRGEGLRRARTLIGRRRLAPAPPVTKMLPGILAERPVAGRGRGCEAERELLAARRALAPR